MRPTLFLDFDDVLCLNNPYSGHDVVRPRGYGVAQPADLWERLFAQSAKDVLLTVMAEFSPAVVITSSWLAYFERPGMETLLRNCGLLPIALALHEAWDVPSVQGKTRLQAIQGWMARHHEGEPFVMLDDVESGTGLRGSALEKKGRVVLCHVNVGLTNEHLPAIRNALVQIPNIRYD